jgi:hypothetical protein
MCNPAGCTFCAVISVFGTFFMFMLGILIQSNYAFIGEWYEPESHAGGAPSQEQIDIGAKNCFIVGAIYLGFVFFSLACVCYQNRKLKRS